MSNDINIEDIQSRLTACFNDDVRIVLWEDAGCEYSDIVSSIDLDCATFIDVTRHELAAKRRILKDEPETKFVIYRGGDLPDAADDLLLDIKLASVPFSCSMEGIWASECGLSPDLYSTISDHAAFFNNKERRAALASTCLPKQTPEQLRFAMVAATLKANDVEPRDAVRSFVKRALAEWAHDNEASLRSIRDSGLEATFWASCKQYLGYDAVDGGQSNVEDLAFRLLEGKCGNVVEDDAAADMAESERILSSLAQDPKTSDVYDAIEGRFSSIVEDFIPECNRTIEALEEIDAIPAIDEWILSAFLAEQDTGGVDAGKIERVWSRRRYMLYAQTYAPYYECLIAYAGFKHALVTYNRECGLGGSLEAIFNEYCKSWHMVDRRYREFFLAYSNVGSGRFKQKVEEAAKGVMADYTNFLISLTDRWQAHLLDDGKWPPANIASQDVFYRNYVELNFPKAEKGKRVGVIVSDALRYEAGVDLSQRLSATKQKGLVGKIKVECEGELCMLPSYTQLGMAALLPDGPLAIDPASTLVTKAGQPTQGISARSAILANRTEGAVALRAADILSSAKLDLDNAPVAFVYHNTIDKTGDSQETETKVFKAVKDSFEEIEMLVRMLVQAGCGKVFITADHGFLYQEERPESYSYAAIDNLSLYKGSDDVSCDHTRRFIIGNAIPLDDQLIEYAAMDLSLEGDYKLAFPRAIMRLRLSGSGARFVHGGASLQENVIPVVKVEVAASKAARATDVDGYVQGRTVITGPTVPLVVYQCAPCSDTVSPLTVKVGVYSKDGQLVSTEEKIVELSSSSTDVEDRKVHVTLAVTDDVDEHASVYVRILKREGATNAFKTAWEQEYSVNRAFGMDF